MAVGDEAEMYGACVRMLEVLDAAKPGSAKSNEASAWRHWLAFCAHRNTEPWRNDPRVHTDEAARERETLVLSFAFMFIYARMVSKPGRKRPPSAIADMRASGPSGPGRGLRRSPRGPARAVGGHESEHARVSRRLVEDTRPHLNYDSW